ncbi:MAG: cupin domain-containing protein [Hyphomonas sp.]|nr:cupin domain-containing protein [Hyphomonas sp.]
MILKRSNAIAVSKAGVDMWIYPSGPDIPQAAVVYQETARGHEEEFRHHTSAFVYYILEGAGEWVIEDEVFPVEAGDVVIVPPGKRFYFRGALKQVCITAPAWTPEGEEFVRTVPLG